MENILGKNYLTTIGGIISAIGACLVLLPKSVDLDPAWGGFVTAIGAALTGVAAKSFNVHSTQVEVKGATKEEVAKDEAIIKEIKAKKE